MKIARVIQDDKETFGIINGEFFFRTKSNTKNKIHTLQELIILINREINNSSNHILEIDSFFERIGYPLTSLKVLPPTTEKNKIICVGINYPKLYDSNLTTKPDHIILFHVSVLLRIETVLQYWGRRGRRGRRRHRRRNSKTNGNESEATNTFLFVAGAG